MAPEPHLAGDTRLAAQLQLAKDIREHEPGENPAALGYAYPVLLGVLLVLGAKGYYAAPLLVCLLASGPFVVERFLRSLARAALLTAAIAAAAVVSVVVALPLIPVERLHQTPIADVNDGTRSRP